ncbi:MAG: helix-turn-helix domain-containing protein [Lachnospiraceae bacterium]|nr:helix-turn-helix domain-containing protein [Lachnospiraceae bacterium]
MTSQRLPAKLKELRKAFSYTQYDVAAALGVVRQTYSHYETGKRSPSPEVLFKLAGLYHISVEDLLQLTVDVDRNISFDAPSPTKTGKELSVFLEYLGDPYNKKRLQFLSYEEKELLYYFGQLSDKDKIEIIEITKIKLRNLNKPGNQNEKLSQ